MRASRAKQERLGVGLYSINDAARLLHAHPNSIRRWIEPSAGLVPRRFDPDEGTLTFLELMELNFIKMFRGEGVSLQTIRKASKAAAEQFDTKYPFSVKRFDTDGRAIFATLHNEATTKVLIQDLAKGQFVFEKIVRPFFHKLEYHGEVVRYWPLEKKGRIVLDPERQFGKPIDSETGMPTRAIYDAFLAGDGQDRKTIAKWFGISVKAVDAAVAFERSLAA